MARTYMHKGHNKVFLHSRIISMKTGRKSESFTRNQKSESSRIKIKLRSSRTNQHQPGRVTNIQQRTESDNTRQTKCKKSLKNLSPPGRWPPTTRWRLRRSLLLHMSNRGAGHRQGTLKATSHQVNMSRPIRGYLQKENRAFQKTERRQKQKQYQTEHTRPGSSGKGGKWAGFFSGTMYEETRSVLTGMQSPNQY